KSCSTQRCLRLIRYLFLQSHGVIFFLPLRPPPISPFSPYTTLFRSARFGVEARNERRQVADPLGRLRGFPARRLECGLVLGERLDRKSTRLNSSHVKSSYAVFCVKK